MTWKGTPGPWAIAPETNGTELVAYTSHLDEGKPWSVRGVVASGLRWFSNQNWKHDMAGIAAVPQLVEALLPFAEFASLSGAECLPDDYAVTKGSGMAARQLTMGDCRAAREALRTAGVLQ